MPAGPDPAYNLHFCYCRWTLHMVLDKGQRYNFYLMHGNCFGAIPTSWKFPYSNCRSYENGRRTIRESEGDCMRLNLSEIGHWTDWCQKNKNRRQFQPRNSWALILENSRWMQKKMKVACHTYCNFNKPCIRDRSSLLHCRILSASHPLLVNVHEDCSCKPEE
ncbi:hypothetical protein Mpal_1117 [Methanosphaerula palustris E1-9c]|uniref:Uncharacterized protein n=1 Tax=Methanosphaerula palustris (strain ATCC BAA-1556 / DSM 19958 / E1-9c) TaxID=521011 RepID=B8GH57_METPE|nr:hypothetical protein Mpal_1117 [Methanosphaerula palustris E1-9c]